LKETLSKLKGKAVVTEAVTLHPIEPELLKIDVAPLAPKLRNNRTAHTDYLRHTQEETATLREIVKSERLLNPLNTSLDYALGNVCPLTRIVTTAILPLREPIPIESNTDKPVVTLFYSRESKEAKKKVPVSNSTINKSSVANKTEPNNSWGSTSSNVPYSIIECRNDHVAKIMGYSDYKIGNVTISRIYFIEGLGYNLFSVGQFCDSDLEVTFRQRTCFICNLDGVDLLTGIKYQVLALASPFITSKLWNMDTAIDQQVAMDEALVPHAKRLRIGRSNFHLLLDIKSKESTLQLEFWATSTVHHHAIRFKMDNKKHIVNLESFRDMLHICPRVPGQSFVEPPFEEEIIAFIRFLGHSAVIRKLTDVEYKYSKKSNEMYYPRFTKVIIHHFMSKDPSIPRRNKVKWHYVRDDHMFSTIKLVSRHQNMQLFSALLPIELTNEDIRNSNDYKEYYVVATGVSPPKPKASVWKTRNSSDTTIAPPTTAAGPRLTTSEKGKQAAKASKAKSLSALSEVEHKDTKKSNEMYYPRFTKVIIHHFMSKDPSIPKRNKVNWHYVRDDQMFTTIKLEYYAVATGAIPSKTKASVRKKKGSSDTTVTPPPTDVASTILFTYAKDEGTCTILGVPDVPTDESDKEISWKSSDKGEDNDDDDDDKEGNYDDDDAQDDDNDQEDVNKDDDDQEEGDDNDDQEEETRDEESFDPIPKTPENTDDKGNSKENLGLNVGREEGQDEEDDADELYRDVNINLEGRGVQMADVHTTQEFEDSHVTLTSVNPDGQHQSLSVSSQFVTN
nr:integrase, catalytic region, zinc finger, CCHC-type, peptidase aspartic, catalytic [Tanacetum cinerariifolium]